MLNKGWAAFVFTIEELIMGKCYQQIEIEAHYKGYLKKQDSDIISLKRDENIKIPINFDFNELSSLSNELKEKLIRAKPQNIS